MFISRLIKSINEYDPYGKHRLNGFKVVYVFAILMMVNMFYNIPNPYFYYFYLPLTAMSAVVLNDDLKKQYQSFIYAVIATCCIAFILNFFSSSPLFFIISSFLIAWLLYVLAIDKVNMLFPLAPVILSLAAYSLNYPSINFNREVMTENIVITLMSMSIIVGALILFPLKYYGYCWQKAFFCFLTQLISDLEKEQGDKGTILLMRQHHLCSMVNLSRMLTNKLPVFSILKINLLSQSISLMYSKANANFKHLDKTKMKNELKLFLNNVEKRKPYEAKNKTDKNLMHMIKSWNRVCLII